jgi:hypothetical protein
VKTPLLERRVVPSIEPSPASPAEVWREFSELTDGGRRIRCMGTARRNPRRLFALGYRPRYKLELFGVTYYLADVRQNEDVRFFVGYLALREGSALRPSVYARLLYKDGSLLWRCASHFAKSADENWIGKGDVKLVKEHGGEFWYSSSRWRSSHPPGARPACAPTARHSRSWYGAVAIGASSRTATSSSRAGAPPRTRAIG